MTSRHEAQVVEAWVEYDFVSIEAHFMDGSQKGRHTTVSNVGVTLEVLKEMISAHL